MQPRPVRSIRSALGAALVLVLGACTGASPTVDAACEACSTATDVQPDLGAECTSSTVPVACRVSIGMHVCSAETGAVAACVSGRWSCSGAGEVPASTCWCSDRDIANGCTCTAAGPRCPDAGAPDVPAADDTVTPDDTATSNDAQPALDASTATDAAVSPDASIAPDAFDAAPSG